ncbi:hypothetical protein AMTRI_Chr13g116130 [Amborella trichopoda]
MFRPRTLMATIFLAFMQEEKLQLLKRREKNQFNWQEATVHTGTAAIKKLSWSLLGHRCKSQQLFMLDGDADWETDDQVK